MKQELAYAMALAFVVGAVGLSVVPSVAAVSADCDEDYLIPDSEPLTARSLGANANETGLEDVEPGPDETLRVELLTNGDKLEFGVFEVKNGKCQASSNTDCGTSEVLDTTGAKTTDSMDCILEAPDSGEREFYVHFENVEENGDSLDYKAWIV